MTLDSSGNLLVGTTAANGKKMVISEGAAEGIEFHPAISTNVNSILHYNRSTATYCTNDQYAAQYRWYIQGFSKMEIGGNGSLYLYAQATGAGNADLRYSTSDGKVTYDTSSRLVKDEIEEIPYGLNTVMALSPKRYIRTDSDNKLEVGFIADEVVEVVPELVGMMEKRFLTMNQEDTEMVAGSVEYNKMTAVLVKAIQEQQATIEALTARIAALES